MANAVVNRQVNVYINSGEAAKAYDVLIKREKLLNEELKKTSDPKRIKQLNAELDKLKEPIDRAAKKMKGELAPSIRDLEMATRKFLNEFKKTGSPEALANFQKFRAELAKAKSDISSLDNSYKGLTSKGVFSGAFWGSFLAGGVTAALSGLSNLFGGAIQEALDADAATKRLEATLDNLGKGDAFDRISRKADEMAAKFRYLDNDDIVGVFNKLIDYGKLTEKEMNDLLPVIIDFAAKSQISIDESASIIIKALEGNGEALKEYGIDIKDAGNETDRLNTIMTTLKEKVDGSGEAFQNSAKGGIATARQELKNLQEDIGNIVIPVLNSLLGWVSKALNGLKSFAREVREAFRFRNSIGNMVDNMVTGIGTDAAVSAHKDFLKKIEKLDDDARKKALKKELDDQEWLANGDKKIAEQSKFNGTYNAVKVDQDLAYRTERIKLLKEEMAIMSDLKPFGITTPDKPVIPKTVIPKIKKEVDEFVQGIKDIGDVYEKTFGRRMADIAKGGVVSGDNLDIAKSIADNIANITANANRSTLAFLDLKVLTSRGKDRLAAQLALLKEEERQALLVTTLTENGKALIQEQYRQKRMALEADYVKTTFQQIGEYANQAIEVFNVFNSIRNDKENAELEADRRRNDIKKSNLERRLKSGTLSHLQYDRELQTIERDQQRREKKIRKEQFEREKAASIAQALINGALAVTNIWATTPKADFGVSTYIMLGLSALATLSSVASIAARKTPEYAEGGVLAGRSHASGGNAVVDGSGRKIAEVEAGEGIVNKRTMADRRQYQVSGTPGQIISRLNSMYGAAWEGGATLVPAWRSFRPQPMNFYAMKSIYAGGGVFSAPTPPANASQDAIFENLSAMVSDMQATTQYLANVLAKGIKADVSLLRFEEQQDRLAAIRADATMVG